MRHAAAGLDDASHGRASRAAALHKWVALQKTLDSGAAVALNGRDLSIADVVAVSFHGTNAHVTDNQDVLQQVADSVSFLEGEIAAGRTIYGVNTGFGGSADTRTHNVERLQSALVQHQNSGILLHADKGRHDGGPRRPKNDLLRSHALPTPIVKAAMLIRCNSLMRGHSGVRISVIKSIITLLSQDMTPVVPLRGSISASGDLSTLSYIAGAIEGNPDIFVRVSSKGENTKTIPANEALRLAGLQPVRLQAKEGLGITNGTAPSCAAASIVVHQANQLALLTQFLTAMGTEALSGTAHNYHPFISAIRPHAGQSEAASNILNFLSGSKLSSARNPDRIGLAQDRYALRTAPQWIGPQLEDLLLATRQVETELNSTTDNPLIDVATGHIHHGGNFQAAVLTSAMEKTMTAVQSLGRLLFAQSSELINNMTNRGLPPNLSADEPSESFTCKGFDINMAAYMAELAYLAHPVSTHMQVAELANQSVNSMALVAARYALEAVEVLSLMAAAYIYVLCQALDLRCMRLAFRDTIRGVILNAVAYPFFHHLEVNSSLNGRALHHAIVSQATDTLLARWDHMAHVDTAERSKAAVQESMGAIMEHLAELGVTPTMEELARFQTVVAGALEAHYRGVKSEFLRSQTTAEYISPASRVVYDFVRKELDVPLNRGVVDHPPLLVAAAAAAVEKERLNGYGGGSNGISNGASNGTSNGVPNGHFEELAGKQAHVASGVDKAAPGRTLGTMAGEIYEALRSGELHSRIMKFGEEAKLWG
ncbi:L-Aspartase-like protein [Podospora appendiculata]|uniref:L-Aspartase-like protein n=1 Tax=Podospora appendiculata TaxID=314037 RepID=A0AAE1CCT9_9PEZI|nr:L-Aspartase-like protein [Podospora appendiculata]